MANQTIKLTAQQLQRINKLTAALESLANELFQEGDELDRQIYDLLFRLQSLQDNGASQLATV